jgi:hypothetical protein
MRYTALAVTVRLDGQEIQLLPAVQDGDHFKIANTTGKGWSSIRPRIFAEQLTHANSRTNGKLVPTIKIAKAIIAALPEQQRLTGYHTEVLAVNVFHDYTGPKTNKAMLRHFFEKLPEAVLGSLGGTSRASPSTSTNTSVLVTVYRGGS